MHLAAESHVDRSIAEPLEFIQTNNIGIFTRLEATRQYWNQLPVDQKTSFCYVSTDKVYGDLESNTELFTETKFYAQSSPDAASKASSDYFVRACFRKELPTINTNCSNNYGSYHYPEKLIPLIILNASEGKPLAGFINGQQIRDWLYVKCHAWAFYKVVNKSKAGETYHIGGHIEKANIDVVKNICHIIEEPVPNKFNNIKQYSDLINYATDCPDHGLHYTIDTKKMKNNKLDWIPEETFQTELRKTIHWYLKNTKWCESIGNNKFNRERLGA